MRMNATLLQLNWFVDAIGVAFGSHSNAHTSNEETVYKLDLPDASLDSIKLGWSIYPHLPYL
jgi:predicted Zn-dependent peptidase